MDEMAIRYILDLNDKMSRKLNKALANTVKSNEKINNSFRKMSVKTGNAMKNMAGKAKILSAGLLLLSSTTLLGFETAMNDVRAISGATAKEFQMLREQAKELGRTTKFSATESGKAQAFLLKAGFKVIETYNAMPATLRLAAAANLDIASSADIVSNVMQGYQLDTKLTGMAVDVLTKTFVTSNTNLQMLGEGFKYAGPVAKAFGLQLHETTAYLGLLGNAGIQASMAGRTLRRSLSNLAKPSKQAARILEKYTIKVFDKFGKINLDKILAKLSKQGAKSSEIMTIFGLNAGPGMLALTSTGDEAIQKYIKTLENFEGVSKRIMDIQMEGLPGAWFRMKSAIAGLIIEIGDAGLTGFFQKSANSIAFFANSIALLNPKILKLIAVFTSITILLPVILSGLGFLAIAIGSISTPILATTGIITGLTVALSTLFIFLDDIKKFFANTRLGRIISAPFIFLANILEKTFNIFSKIQKTIFNFSNIKSITKGLGYMTEDLSYKSKGAFGSDDLFGMKYLSEKNKDSFSGKIVVENKTDNKVSTENKGRGMLSNFGMTLVDGAY